jgi:hypothetical protein
MITPLEDTTPLPVDFTRPMPLRSIADAGGDLDQERFARLYGEAFLVHQGPLEALGKTQRAELTLYGDAITRRIQRSFDMPLMVLPVRPTGRSPFPRVVCLGRAKNNDVVVTDASVSKLHAVFHRSDDGGWLVQDARSRNGTFLDNAPVPVDTRGEPLRITSGATMRFGSVELVFLTTVELWTLARLTRRAQRT